MHLSTIITTLSLSWAASAYVNIFSSSSSSSDDAGKRDLLDAALDSSIFKRQSPPSAKTVQIVTVSNNNSTLKFFPENIQADVGSIVQFQFYPKNHTITESSFAAPCMPLAANLTSPTRPGQRSGFVPVAADTQFRPVYNMLINDTKPIWIYCGQAPHCQKGMAMVINQNMSSPNTLEKYKAAAAALPVPGASSSTSTTMSGFATTSMASSGGAYTTAPAATTITTQKGPSLGTATTSGSATASVGTFTGGAAGIVGSRSSVGWLMSLVGAVAVLL